MSLAFDYTDDDASRYNPASGTISVGYDTIMGKAVGGATAFLRTRVPDRFTEFDLYDVRNWDGYDAEPISQDTVNAARQFDALLDRKCAANAEIAPSGDGTIGFEWQTPTALIYCDIGPGKVISARKIYGDGKVELYEATIGVDADTLIRNLFA